MKCGKTQISRVETRSISANKKEIANNPYQPPESIAPSINNEEYVDLASRGSRFLANLVDGIILGGVTWIIILYVLGYKFKEMATAGFGTQILLAGMGVVVFLIIQGPFLAKNSQTIGKKILNIKIVQVDGSKIDFMSIILKRYAPMWVIAYIPFIGGIASLVNILFIFRSDRRCIHDLIAGTMVVRLA